MIHPAVTKKAPSHPVIPVRPVATPGDPDDGTHFVSMYQKQPDIYPRAVKGWFATWRWIFVWLTQWLFYGLLSVASLAFAASVALRSPFQVDVVKDRGALARVVEDGAIENVFRLQIMNRTELPQTYRIDAQGIPGLELQTVEVSAPPAGIRSVVVSLRLPYSAAQSLLGRSAPVHFEVSRLDSTHNVPAVQREKSTFFIPR